MIFNAQYNLTIVRPRNAPHVKRVDDVPEVQISSWRRRETSAPTRREFPLVQSLCERVTLGRAPQLSRDTDGQQIPADALVASRFGEDGNHGRSHTNADARIPTFGRAILADAV